MQTFALDSNNNLIVTTQQQTKSGADAIIQDIKTLLLMFQTEYPFNKKKGIHWYNLLQKNNKNLIRETIIKRILEDSRIKNVNNIQIFSENGVLKISAELYTSEGVLNV